MQNLKTIAGSIDKAQSSAIQSRATAGQVRSFELTWVSEVIAYHRYKVVPAFTAKQRGNLKDLVSRLGPEESLLLIKFSVKKWVSARMVYPFLPPRPVFDSFYFHRDKFLALMVEEKEKLKKSTEAIEHIKEIKSDSSSSKASLVEMFKKARNNGGKGTT